MNGFLSIKGKVEKPSSAVQSFFNGEEETVPEKLRRQEIANDLRYGFESTVACYTPIIMYKMTEKDAEEEALGDVYDYDKYYEEKEEKKKEEENSNGIKKEKKPVSLVLLHMMHRVNTLQQ